MRGQVLPKDRSRFLNKPWLGQIERTQWFALQISQLELPALIATFGSHPMFLWECPLGLRSPGVRMWVGCLWFRSG